MNRKTYILIALLLFTSCSGGTFTPPNDAGSDAESVAELGARCGELGCVEGASCIRTNSNGQRCMANCDTLYEVCDSGALCLESTAASICYDGGTSKPTEPCNSNLDCETGGLCVGSQNAFFCIRGCSPTLNGCETGEFCAPLQNGGGICRSATGSRCDAPSCDTCSLNDGNLSAGVGNDYCTQTCDGETCDPGARCVDAPGWTNRFCLQSCRHESECRFNDRFDCFSPDDCDGHSDPTLCRDLTADGSLCLPKQ